jgi:hypothetical protein
MTPVSLWPRYPRWMCCRMRRPRWGGEGGGLRSNEQRWDECQDLESHRHGSLGHPRVVSEVWGIGWSHWRGCSGGGNGALCGWLHEGLDLLSKSLENAHMSQRSTYLEYVWYHRISPPPVLMCTIHTYILYLLYVQSTCTASLSALHRTISSDIALPFHNSGTKE